MAGTKLQQFSGMAPRVSEELLPVNAAQEAVNCAMDSGDIVPAGQYVQVSPPITGFTGGFKDNTRTIYGMRNPSDPDDMIMMSWDDDVEYVLGPTFNSDGDQVLYFTDSTGAHLTTFRRARRKGPPYPKDSYKMGLPLPDIKVTVEKTDKKIPGYDGGSLPGVKEIPTIRSYVFTYFCDLFEKKWESIASEPSDPIEVVEGTVCKIHGLPWEPPVPDGPDSFPIGGINVYRTVTSTSGTEFFKIVTLPFYCPLASVTVDGDKQTIITQNPHNLTRSAWFKSNDFMPVTKVLEILDEYTFVATYKGGDAFSDPTNHPRIVYDVTPQWTRSMATSRRNPISSKVYGGGGGVFNTKDPDTGEGFAWWDGTNLMRGEAFEDWYDVVTLMSALKTDDYDPPPPGLRGLIRVNDKVLCGHANGKLYFTEPGVDIAWPALYETLVPEVIVALETVASGVLVLTTGHPYIAHVSDPAAGVSLERLDSYLPCLNAKSVVATPYGVVWMSTNGLAVYQTGRGAVIVTEPTIRSQHDWGYDFKAGAEWRIPCTDGVSLASPTRDGQIDLHPIAKMCIAWWDGWNYVLAWAPAWIGGDVWWRECLLSYVREGDSQHFVRWFLSDGAVNPAVAASAPQALPAPAAPQPSVYNGWVVDEDMDLYGFLVQTWRDDDNGYHGWFDFAWQGYTPTFDDANKRIICKSNGQYPGRHDGMNNLVSARMIYGKRTVPNHKSFVVRPGETYMLVGTTDDRHVEQNIADGDNSDAPLSCIVGVYLDPKNGTGGDGVTYFWHQSSEPYGLFTVPAHPWNSAGRDEWLMYPVVEFSRSFARDIDKARQSGTPQDPSKMYGVTMDITLTPRLYKMKPASISDISAAANRLLCENGDTFLLENDSGVLLLEEQTVVMPVVPPVAQQYSAVPQAVWHDSLTGHTYCVYRNSSGGLVGAAIDLHTQVDTNAARWKSKAFVMPTYCNLGAARVIADFPENNTVALVTFRLYANKVLVAEVPLSDSRPFRLPTNYRHDTFEVELVNIRCRVRAVHVAETVLGLREV